jgi:hypothetical protein
MAIAKRTVIVANPAEKRSKKTMAMSLKQKLHFGSKKQRAAAKRSISAKRAKARHAPRTKPNRAPARKPRRKNPGEIISLLGSNPASRGKKKAMAKAKRSNKKRPVPRGRTPLGVGRLRRIPDGAPRGATRPATA